MSGRQGFALLAVLWLIVALVSVAGAGIAVGRAGSDTSRNRVILRRAAWARDACTAILIARYSSSKPAAGIDSIDLGRDVWCSARVDDPSARLNLNRATSAQLQILLGNDSLVDALLDWRDPDNTPRAKGAERDFYLAERRPPPRNAALASIAELRQVRGFEQAPDDWLSARFTHRGSGRINVNAASAAILASVPGLRSSDAALIESWRVSPSWSIRSLDELMSRLGPARVEELGSGIADVRSYLAFEPAELVISVEGRVGASPLRARAVLTSVPLPTRLAVVSQEVW